MKLIARVVLNGFGLWVATRVVPGIEWNLDFLSPSGLLTLLGAGLLLGLLNLLVKPVLVFFSIPLLLLTLGLFYLVINGLVLKLADLLLDSLTVHGLVAAMLGGVVLSLFNLVVRWIGRERE